MFRGLCAWVLVWLLAWPNAADSAGQSEPPADAAERAEELIELNFPGEIEIKTFADYVSDRLKISILYDESIRGKHITVRSSQPIDVGNRHPRQTARSDSGD